MKLFDVLVANPVMEFAHYRNSLTVVPHGWSFVVYCSAVDNLGVYELVDARRKFIACYTSLYAIWGISFEVFTE